VDGTGSGSSAVVGFSTSGVEPFLSSADVLTMVECYSLFLPASEKFDITILGHQL